LFRSSFVVAQTPHSAFSLQKMDLILPSTVFTEKEGTFINMEGRVQKTSMALAGPNLARDDVKIVNALFNNYLKEYQPFKPKNSKFFLGVNDAKKTFVKPLFFKKTRTFVKIFKTPIKTVLSNFFLSNAITKNSLIMGKCASLFKKNYQIFV